MSRQIYINLPVADLARSQTFFSALGFTFDDTFSDDTGICMIVSEQIFVMLLTHEKFGTFTPNTLVDARSHTEVLLCLSCESRHEVDALIAKAQDAGGSTFNAPQDHGFMYGHAFQDLDGHIWELVHMDLEATQQVVRGG